MDYFSSDWHLYHKNIIAYEQRPFDSLDHMHDEIIKRHNKVVSKRDRLFVAGDISFTDKERTREIITKINGQKILVKGNHDRGRSNKWFLEAGFDQVMEWPILYQGFYVISHEPIYLNESMPYVNIHGHLHKNKMEGKQYFNCGVDLFDFYPVRMDRVKELLGIQEDTIE